MRAQVQAVQDQLDKFAQALDLVPAMVRKLDGEILLWGRGLEALYGWPVEEAIGRVSQDLLATRFPVPLPEIQAELLQMGVWQGELVRTHRDGRRLVVASRWALYRGAGDDAASVLEFDSDITETRRAQAMLKEREARLRSILETAPDAIVTIDERGIIQSFSNAAEKLFGYASGEVIGRRRQDAHARAASRKTSTVTWSDTCAPARSTSSASAARWRRSARTAPSFRWSSRSAR